MKIRPGKRFQWQRDRGRSRQSQRRRWRRRRRCRRWPSRIRRRLALAAVADGSTARIGRPTQASTNYLLLPYCGGVRRSLVREDAMPCVSASPSLAIGRASPLDIDCITRFRRLGDSKPAGGQPHSYHRITSPSRHLRAPRHPSAPRSAQPPTSPTVRLFFGQLRTKPTTTAAPLSSFT